MKRSNGTSQRTLWPIFFCTLLTLAASTSHAQQVIQYQGSVTSNGSPKQSPHDVSPSFSAEPNALGQWVPAATIFQLMYFDFVTCLAVNGPNLFAGTDAVGVWLTTDNGASWNLANTGLTSGALCFAVSGTNLFAGTNFGVWLSTNNGTSWNRSSTGKDTGYTFRALAMSGANLFAGGDVVSLSTNDGKSWTSVNNGLPHTTTVNCLAVSGTNVFAGTSAGGVFLTTNNGTSWTAVNNGLTDTTRICSLAAIGTNIFVGTLHSGVFLSSNNGSSWISANTGLPANTYVNSFAVSGTTLLAGANNGFYFSTNNGTSWTVDNDGLSNTFFYAIAVSGTNLFGGFDGSISGDASIWKLSDPGLSAAVSPVASIDNSLRSYPNPFSRRATINFSLPESGVVEVSIVNLLGLEVAHLFSGELEAGDHAFTWDANGAAAGTYFSIVRSNGMVTQAPMMLER